MKILFIITQSERGGAQRWVRDVALGLKKRGFRVVVAAGGEGEFLKNTGLDMIKIDSLVRNISPLKDMRAFFSIRNIIKRENPDILQLVSTKAGLLGSMAGKIAGVKKIIYRIGGWTFNDPRPKWQRWLFRKIEKWSSKFKDKIIVNSKKDYDDALKLKIATKDKLALLYNGIQLGDRPQERPLGPVLKQGIKAVTVANFYKTKGLEYLIEAAEILQKEQIIFMIIGDGKGKKSLESLIRKYKLRDKIFLIGAKDNIEKELENFDIFILPSLKEGMPYALLEAMAASLAVVATDVGAVPEIIENGRNGLLVRPGDPPALADAIEKIIHDLELYSRLISNSRDTVEKKFSFDKMIEEYLSIINIV